MYAAATSTHHTTDGDLNTVRQLVASIQVATLTVGALIESTMGPLSVLAVAWFVLVVGVFSLFVVDAYEVRRTRRIIAAYSDEWLLDADTRRRQYVVPVRTAIITTLCVLVTRMLYGANRCVQAPALTYVASIAGVILALLVTMDAPVYIRWLSNAAAVLMVGVAPMCGVGVYGDRLLVTLVRTLAVPIAAACLIDRTIVDDVRLRWPNASSLQWALVYARRRVDDECERVLAECMWLHYAHPVFIPFIGAIVVAERRRLHVRALERSMHAMSDVRDSSECVENA